jgi:hypothetical protein
MSLSAMNCALSPNNAVLAHWQAPSGDLFITLSLASLAFLVVTLPLLGAAVACFIMRPQRAPVRGEASPPCDKGVKDAQFEELCRSRGIIENEINHCRNEMDKKIVEISKFKEDHQTLMAACQANELERVEMELSLPTPPAAAGRVFLEVSITAVKVKDEVLCIRMKDQEQYVELLQTDCRFGERMTDLCVEQIDQYNECIQLLKNNNFTVAHAQKFQECTAKIKNLAMRKPSILESKKLTDRSKQLLRQKEGNFERLLQDIDELVQQLVHLK